MNRLQPVTQSDAILSRPGSQWISNLTLTLPFLILYWINLAHHQLWQDEINAWGIAAASPTFSKLLYYVHWEGHPWLWYGILWVPSQFTHNPAALKWVEAIFGTAIYLMIGLVSPFTRWQKVLIFLCYFVSFEYTVMSRMYSVMFLLALLYVARRTRKPDAVVGNVLLLGALTNVDTTGILLSGALLLEYFYSLWLAHRGTAEDTTERSRFKRGLALAAAGYLGLLALAINSARLAKGISYQNTGKFGSEMFQPRRIVEAIGNLTATVWWPISKTLPRHFWATDSIENKWVLLLVPFVVYGYWRIFRRDRNLLLMMTLTLGFGMLFADVIFAGRVRHWGIAFVAFLLALWMQRVAREREGDPSAGRWSPWAYGLMGLGALSGVTAMASSWTHPFSQASATAEWIRTHEPPNVALVGLWDMNFASMGEELQRPMYFMECACTDTFKLFAADRDEFPPAELPGRANLAMKNLGVTRLVLSSYRPLEPKEIEALRQASLIATPLVQFDGADQVQESYFLYDVVRP